MNERIRELAEQAGVSFLMEDDHSMVMNAVDLEKFAELIVKECVDQIYPDWIKQGETRAETPLGFAVKRVKEHFGVEG